MKLTKTLYRFDINQSVQNLNCKYVDFVVNDTVYRVQVENGTCKIPDEFLQNAGNQKFYECFSDGTKSEHLVTVHDRPQPPDYVYTPTERETFDSLVEKVNIKLEEVPEYINDYFTEHKDEFKGEKGEDGKGAVSDWEQTNETADNFIKNKPFWDKSEVYTFPNADYETPAYEAEGLKLYRISEGIPPIDDYNGMIVNYHIKDTNLSYSVKLYNNGVNDSDCNLFIEDFSIFFINYIVVLTPIPIDEAGTTMVPIGVYFIPNDDGELFVLDSLVKENVQQIDKKFIPEPNELTYETTTLTFNNANQLFASSTFKKPPFKIKGSYFDYIFENCSQMEECTLFYNGGANPSYRGAFSSCNQLKVIRGDMHGPVFDNYTFNGCYELTDIEDISNVNTDMKLPHSTKLNNLTVTKIFKALVKSDTTHTLVLPSNIIDGLTNEQLAIVPSNWTIQ